ncbi:helix-turn-helix transcriptional regulator [Dactylosporangium sp. NPDC051485]|uniref:helix-turn-helix domain-containing protein n=1 Tax=Dactylosporangium sp. NPDC051485 TaxID=3154846 RepID=UPI00341ECE92
MAPEDAHGQQFGTELKRWRRDRDLSLEALADLSKYSKGYLSKIESGAKPPNIALARRLDNVLGAGGALAGLVPVHHPPRAEAGAADAGGDWTIQMQDDGAGGFQAISRRTLLTSTAATVAMGWPRPRTAPTGPVLGDGVAAYVQLLHDVRRLGQSGRPADVLKIAAAIVHSLRTQAGLARGADRTGLLRVGARFAEYSGWMAQESGDPRACAWWNGLAGDMAHEAGDGELGTYLLIRAAELALYDDDPLGTVRAAEAALAAATTPRVRAMALQRLAQGHGLAGNELECLRMLDRAGEQAQEADPAPAAALPVLGSATMRDPTAFVRGWCLLDLARPRESAEILGREFECIPAHAHRVRARYGARLALALAEQRELEAAGTVLGPVAEVVRFVDSATVRSDLRRLNQTLRRWHGDPAVVRIMPELAMALHP